MPSDFDATSVRFDEATSLVPAVIQDVSDGAVLMLGYMSRESLARTLESKRVTFHSRSRGRLWEKGETSGNYLQLVSISTDCDGDAILVRSKPAGPTCHTGARSCFSAASEDAGSRLATVLEELAGVIGNRDRERPGGSYTTGLLESGIQRVAQKVAEEAVETALAAVAEPKRLAEESADLLYHLLVLWQTAGLESRDVAAELVKRRGPRG